MNLWVIITGLILVALSFVILPWRQKKAEGNPGGFKLLSILGVVPVATVGLYLHLGAPAIIDEQAMLTAQTSHDAEGMLRALERKLKNDPKDVEGWYTLGRAYIAQNRPADAAVALGKAAELAPKEARILAQYAEALALKDGGFAGRPQELISAALDIDYDDEKALELAGLSAYQQEKWAEAIHFWRRLLKKMPPQTETYDAVTQALKIAEKRAEEASGLGERARLMPPEAPRNPH